MALLLKSYSHSQLLVVEEFCRAPEVPPKTNGFEDL